jgi:hypothetical protein
MEAQEALLILMKSHGSKPSGKDLRVTGRRRLNKEYTITERVGYSTKRMHILVLTFYFLGIIHEFFLSFLNYLLMFSTVMSLE